ncbi:MAG: hypothetical protein Q8S24_01610, partial [Eubacteriales bacterium]|nr:hypothetical protein [Eubacteriales bacterium]
RSVPLKSLESIMVRESIDVVVVSVTMDFNLRSAEHLIDTIRAWRLNKQPIVMVGGNALKNDSTAKDFLKADIFVNRIEDLDTVIDQLESDMQK